MKPEYLDENPNNPLIGKLVTTKLDSEYYFEHGYHNFSYKVKEVYTYGNSYAAVLEPSGKITNAQPETNDQMETAYNFQEGIE
jgi:hypothetical protein